MASQRLGIARHGLEIMWREPTAANRATGTELKVCNCHRKQAQEAMTTDRRRRRQGRWHRPQTVHQSQKTSPRGYGNRPPSKAPGPQAQGSKCVTVEKNKPRGLEQPTAVDGARATGTRLRVCNCDQKQAHQATTTDRRRRRQGHWHKAHQKHAQEPRATNRRREGFGRVREDLGMAKV